MLKIGVIGAGVHARRVHLPIISDIAKKGDLKLKIIADLDSKSSEEAKATYGFEEATQDGMLICAHPDVDAIYIFGSSQVQYGYAKEALNNGKHVFLEKSLVETPEQITELVELSKLKNKVIVAGFNRRFQVSVQRALSQFSEAFPLLQMEAVFHKPALGLPVPYGAKTWLNANAIHAVDVIIAAAGSLPDSLVSVKTTSNGDSDTFFAASMSWQNGMIASFSSANAAGMRKESYWFHGAGKSYLVEDGKLYAYSQEKLNVPDLIVTDEPRSDFVFEHEEFINSIKESRVPLHSLGNFHSTLLLTQAIESGFVGSMSSVELGAASVSKNLAAEENKKVRKFGIYLVEPKHFAAFFDSLAVDFNIFYGDLDTISDSDRKSIVGLLIGNGGRVTDQILDALPNLKVVSIAAASLKKYNPQQFIDRNIKILNASDVYGREVAEFTVSLAALGLKRAFQSHDAMRTGGWGFVPRTFKTALSQYLGSLKVWFLDPKRKQIYPVAYAVWKNLKSVFVKNAGTGSSRQSVRKAKTLHRAKVGIIGWGETSRWVVEYLKPFECEVRIFSENAAPISEELPQNVKFAPLHEVIDSDVVTLHRGLTPKTVGFFNAEKINALPSGVLLINTARGGLINEAALVERLKRNDIFVCLDVFEEEPLAHDSPLRKLPNVFLTSHIAGSSPNLIPGAAKIAAQKISNFLKGGSQNEAIDSNRLSMMT